MCYMTSNLAINSRVVFDRDECPKGTEDPSSKVAKLSRKEGKHSEAFTLGLDILRICGLRDQQTKKFVEVLLNTAEAMIRGNIEKGRSEIYEFAVVALNADGINERPRSGRMFLLMSVFELLKDQLLAAKCAEQYEELKRSETVDSRVMDENCSTKIMRTRNVSTRDEGHAKIARCPVDSIAIAKPVDRTARLVAGKRK